MPFCCVCTSKLVDFPPVQQQLPFPQRVVVSRAPRQVLRDVTVYQPGLPGANLRVGFPQRRLALPKRLHLGADQHQARLEFFEEIVIVGGGAILRDNFYAFILRFFRGVLHSLRIIAAARNPPQVADLPGFSSSLRIYC